MIIPYLRSSSYGAHEMCPQRYYIEYNLGLRSPSGKKADLGTIVHKGLEVLAWYKKCKQDKVKKYTDDAFGVVQIADITPEWAINKAFNYYSAGSPHHTWTEADRRLCQRWMQTTLNLNNGLFDPRHRNIITPEQRFDLTVDKHWAKYKYDLPTGGVLEGQLGLKGTIDLIVQDEPGLIEVIDWKTGRRLDWATGEEKTYKKLRYDPQLCLYHLAVSKLYPDAEEIFITIVYINDGGPFTLCFDKSDIEYTERIIRSKFETIRDTTRPQLKKSWKCTKFCYFGMHKAQGSSKTICEFIKDEVRVKGMDETTRLHGRPGAYSEYGEGGGRKDNEQGKTTKTS